MNRLTDLDIAVGMPLGFIAPDLPAGMGTPRAAIERVLLHALGRRRLAVSFSGGRDSSVLLALATALARREGLADPVPCTVRFPGDEDTVESSWQEDVVRHLGLSEWERVDVTEPFGLLGPTAVEGLRRHGVLWPPNAYLHVPVLARCAGSVLVTGMDGDVLFDGWPWGRALRRHGRADVRALAAAVLPAGAQARRAGARVTRPWIAAEMRGVVARELVDTLHSPLTWRRWVRRYAGRRRLVEIRRSYAVLGADHDVAVVHPLAEPAVIAAVARAGWLRCWPDRTAAYTDLFGDVVPAPVLSRTGKASFATVVSDGAAEFAGTWSGRGVAHIDVPALRAEWRSPTPHFGSLTALHAAWLTDDRAPSRRVGGRGTPNPAVPASEGRIAAQPT